MSDYHSAGHMHAYVPEAEERCVWCDESMPGWFLKQHQLERHPFECQFSWVTQRRSVLPTTKAIQDFRRANGRLKYARMRKGIKE